MRRALRSAQPPRAGLKAVRPRPALAREATRARALADAPLAQLGFVSDAERAALAREPVAERTFASGNVLVREGSAPSYLYLLTAGWVCRHVTTMGGARQISALIVPGGVCNFDNLLLERADAGVTALTEARVLMLPRERALALAAEHRGVARAFTWMALAENAILSRWAVGLGRRSAKQRLAHLLCEMSVRIGQGDLASSRFELPLTQEMLADTLGLTAVHVNRTLQQLRAEGYVVAVGRTVTIPNPEALRAFAEFDRGYLREIEPSAAVA